MYHIDGAGAYNNKTGLMRILYQKKGVALQQDVLCAITCESFRALFELQLCQATRVLRL